MDDLIQRVRDGELVLVPREATDGMRESAANYGGGIGYSRQRGCESAGVYSDLLAAAPDHSAELLRALDAKQARIDELMLEYCPDEMTEGQIAEWARHQSPVDDAAMATPAEPQVE